MAGSMMTFNIQHGLPEALVRGYRLGFLTDVEYHHLTQCETLEDVKLNLQETDYGSFLQNDASSGSSSQLSPSLIRTKALEKLVGEFNYLRSQASQPLAKFLDYITYDYQIDNVILILRATLTNPSVRIPELLEQTHPLGRFNESTMKSISAFENSPKGYAELYQTVLIDTPVGKYMQLFLKEEGDKAMQATGEMRDLLEEMPTTKLEHSLRKYYLEDFYHFCTKEIGGETGEVMAGLLKSRADATAINITLNSFNTSLNDPNMRQTDRKLLYPSIGYLYPEGTDKLSFVGDESELSSALAPYKGYSGIFEAYRSEDRTIDDLFFEKEVMECEAAFEGQFNFACFYSYVRLREAEIRNLVWVCECIVQKAKSRITQHFVPVFSKDSPWRA